MRRAGRHGLPLLLVAGLAGPASLSAQGYRAEVTAAGSVLELRPLVRDSLPEADVPGEGLRRRLADGTVASCTPGEFCRWYRSGDVEAVQFFTQEARVAAWPGVRGLSAHVHLRGRYGSDDLWPRSGQELEAVTAYVSWDQGDVRARAGRLARADGLGYRNFDGASVLWRGFAPVRLEAFGGWSLGPNLNAPRSGDLLSEADEFAPDDRGLLLGVAASAAWGRRASGAVAYQREIRTDLGALYTERVSLDGRALLGELSAAASLEVDLSAEEFNEARLRVDAPVSDRVSVAGELRHYRPFFELWTIWGAFSPVGFREGRAEVHWTLPGPGLALEVGGAYRAYEEAGGGADFVTLRDNGWRVSGAASWARDGWFAGGGYRTEVGFGAARSGGDVRAGRLLGEDARVAVRVSSTRTVGELRLGEQGISGVGLEGTWRVGAVAVAGSGGLYRLSFDDRPGSPDWTQARAHLSVSYRFGTEPGEGR